jgi:preprotein translocase subunit SecG
MMFVIGLLTFVMVLNCLVLIFLVLIQLPKKEAGAGLAFGGGTTDALFGAGSGTVLTKITKYSAGIFFVLAISLSFLRTHTGRSTTEFERKLEQGAPAGLPVSQGAAPLPGTNAGKVQPEATNVPVTPPPAGAPAQK